MHAFTRSALRQELRDHIKTNGHTTASYSDEALNRSLARSLGDLYGFLADIGDGTAETETTLTTPGPGASNTVALPADFLSLRVLLFLPGGSESSAVPLAHVEPRIATRDVYTQLTGQPRWYHLTGPAAGSVAQKLRVYPALSPAPDELRLRYATQAPSLGDPADPGDDTIMVDLVSPPVMRALVAVAGAESVARDDRSQYERARVELQQAVQGLARVAGHGDHGVRRLADYCRSGGVRYPWYW